jgi:tetratricopeptide (TPR) repeat protein
LAANFADRRQPARYVDADGSGAANSASLNGEEIMSLNMTAAWRYAFFAAGFGFYLATGVPARADGGGGGGGGSDTNCPPGEVFDARSMRCVKQQAGVLPDSQLADYAYSLAKAERFEEALQVLNLLKNPNTAKALNYRGYATRKLGRLDEGIAYYRKSVALDPRYAQVREYLGEAYVIKGDMARAKAQLRAIKRICGTECEEYEDLAKAIAEQAKA